MNNFYFFNEILNLEYQKNIPHVLKNSPWPVLNALSLFSLLFLIASFFHGKTTYSRLEIIFSLILLINIMTVWGYDVIWESITEKQHSDLITFALKYSFFLFIISEIFFFVSFFWSFFHLSLSPNVFIFSIWPPKNIPGLDPWGIPFLNTIILLSSGVILTKAHLSILEKKENSFYNFLFATILLGIIFLLLQFYEYTNCPFNINDSGYGSTFFLLTGFHGLHVLVGTVLLLITLLRVVSKKKIKELTAENHLGLECAAYYWHFVDIVWLFLFISVYCWSKPN